MTQLQRTSESFAGTDQRWLGSREGTDTARTVTLDYTAWVAKAVNGRIKGGEPMVRNAVSGKYTPATTKVDGFLLTDIPFRTDAVNKPDAVAPMLDRGRVVQKYLPSTIDPAQVNPRFTVVKSS